MNNPLAYLMPRKLSTQLKMLRWMERILVARIKDKEKDLEDCGYKLVQIRSYINRVENLLKYTGRP